MISRQSRDFIQSVILKILRNTSPSWITDQKGNQIKPKLDFVCVGICRVIFNLASALTGWSDTAEW